MRMAARAVALDADGVDGPVACGVRLPMTENLTTPHGRVLAPPDQRRPGYGSAMLDRVLDVARGHGRARTVAPVRTQHDGVHHPRWPHPEAPVEPVRSL